MAPPAENVTWHPGALSAADRAAALGARGATLWMTGLSGAGKSSLAVALEARLIALGVPAYRLDGDNLRHGLCADLGFSAADRHENLRRVGHVAALFCDAGLITLTAFIAPYQADRAQARALHAAAGLPFYEIFVDAPLALCEARDPKGLYAKARRGEINGMTGIDAPYEAPAAPDLRVENGDGALEAGVQALLDFLTARGHLPGPTPTAP